jgi:hypothetical protein
MTAEYQTKESSPSVTLPTTVAFGAMKLGIKKVGLILKSKLNQPCDFT